MKTVNCPRCGAKIYPGVLLGKLTRGHKKTITPADRERRRRAMMEINARRRQKI